MTIEKLVNQHKRLAMGDTVKGYAKGGTIARGSTVASAMPMVDVKATGRAVNPLRAARAANGIPGFLQGGQVGDKDAQAMMKRGGKAKK